MSSERESFRIIRKRLQDRVDIVDPNDQLNPELKTVVMDILRQRYLFRNYSSCQIVEIVDVLNEHLVPLYSKDDTSIMYVDVSFEVLARVEMTGNIIHGMEVKKIDKSGTIICANSNTAAVIVGNNALQGIKEKQIIPIKVGKTKHKLYGKSLSVNSLPFVPTYRDNIIYKTSVDTPSRILDEKLRSLGKYLDRIDMHDSQVKGFFLNLLYPYKKRTASEHKTDGNKLVPIREVLKEKHGKMLILSLPDNLDLMQMCIVVHAREPSIESRLSGIKKTNKKELYVSETFEVVMGHILTIFEKYLDTIDGLCNIYSTMDIVKKNKSIWNIYNQAKR